MNCFGPRDLPPREVQLSRLLGSDPPRTFVPQYLHPQAVPCTSDLVIKSPLFSSTRMPNGMNCFGPRDLPPREVHLSRLLRSDPPGTFVPQYLHPQAVPCTSDLVIKSPLFRSTRMLKDMTCFGPRDLPPREVQLSRLLRSDPPGTFVPQYLHPQAVPCTSD